MTPTTCDHTNGTRTYEGLWGRRSRRFCPCSDLPTAREREAEAMAELDGREQSFILGAAGGIWDERQA